LLSRDSLTRSQLSWQVTSWVKLRKKLSLYGLF